MNKSAKIKRYESLTRKALRTGEPVPVRSGPARTKRETLVSTATYINQGRMKSMQGVKAYTRTVDSRTTLYIQRPDGAPVAKSTGRPLKERSHLTVQPVKKQGFFRMLFGL